jgi:pimeloyl-ACP methyl ester carboxylesterase
MMRRISHCAALLLASLMSAPAHLCAQSLDTLLVTVDGHRMRLLVSGQGSPTIVLEAGSGGTAGTWRALQPALTPLGRIVSYDRAGLGRSEPSIRPRTARVIAEELRAALMRAQLAPPFLLVAHSAGGVYARMFATIYPSEVIGLVLVDPAAEAFEARAKREFPSVHARFDSIFRMEIASAPPGEVAEENEWFSNLALVQASDATMKTPTILLSSPRADMAELAPLWTDEHRRWTAFAPSREYVRIEGTGHSIHRERPDVVIDAVKRMLATYATVPRR